MLTITLVQSSSGESLPTINLNVKVDFKSFCTHETKHANSCVRSYSGNYILID